MPFFTRTGQAPQQDAAPQRHTQPLLQGDPNDLYAQRSHRSTPQAAPPSFRQSVGDQSDPYSRMDTSSPSGYPREKQEYRPQPPPQHYSVREDQRQGYPQPQGHGVPQVYHHSQGQAGYQADPSGLYNVAACPSDTLALTNRLVVNPNDFDSSVEYVRLKHNHILSIIPDPTGQLPPRTIGPSKGIRQWAGISMQGEQVEIEVYNPKNGDWAGSVDLEVGYQLKKQESHETYDTEQLGQVFITAFSNLPLTPLQTITFDYRGLLLKATVRSVSTLDGTESSSPESMGIIMEGTEINWFKDPSSNIKLKNMSTNRGPSQAILAPDFKFEDMGIGGLDTEFQAIFRRAFASRVFPPGLVEKLGITHAKGILLYGPPGTGKTLMARQIGKMLNAREPKIVNGPEILNKFVGASEENIRKLFADAEKEQKEKGDESGLHIIIFDEIDAICKQRGSGNAGGTGVGDSVVNQLLSKMDGVDQLNNVLVIGMTNRKDMIDDALLRPGRFEIHIEISLPDQAGRVQILTIHTAKMKENQVMSSDVDVVELASLTKNFSGAELQGLVKSATSFAFNRHIKVGTMAGVSSDVSDMKITRADFLNALEEVHAAFGVAEEELSAVVDNGIIHYSPTVEQILRDGSLYVEQVRNSDRTHLVSVLLHGPPGSGKTALAATMGLASEYPFIKLISPESMVGYSESAKVAELNKIFSDSYKSPISVIIVDSIERILDWNPIGPRFSNNALQALVVLLGKRPPKGKRLLVLATTSNRAMLNEMEMTDAFDAEIRVPAIDSLSSVAEVIKQVELFPPGSDGVQQVLSMLQQAGLGGDGRLNIGVKKLLSMTEMARQDANPAEKLVGSLIQASS